MFGSSTGFGGFGAQQQNNQQQQQQPAQTGGLFGAPQQQQQVQQPAAGGFGGLGAAQNMGFGAPQGSSLFGATPAQSAAAPSSGFTFGAPAQPAGAAAGASGFGQQAQKPGGFGGFGAAPAAGAGTFGGFGAAAQTPAFGAPAAGTGAFGAKPATGGLFGQQPAQQQTGFGQPQQQQGGLFGATPALGAPQGMPTQGTSNPPYQPFVQTETDANGTTKHDYAYQCITMIPAYRAASLEELRLQDYQQGRKTGQQGPQAGAMTGGFGQQQQQPQQGGLFGQQQQQQPSTGLFGQQQQQPATGFGQQPATGGLFGQQQQQPQQTGGLFGAAPAVNTGGGLFGNTQQQQPQSGGLFGGQQQQQPAAGGFSFGGASTSQTPATGTTGGFTFGQTPAQPKPATGGLFGSTPTTGFGAQPQQQQAGASTGFSFGAAQPQQQQQQNTGFGGTSGGFSFGAANNNAPKPLFGQAPATSSAPTFGGFGAPASSAATATANKPAFSFGGGLGTSGAGATGSMPATSGGLFGQAAPAPTSQPTGGLFGGFGQQQQQQPQQPAAGGFGSGGLFGQKPAATGGLFGSQPQQQQPAAGGFGAPAAGGGLFGSAPKPATGGLFGAPAQPSAGLFGGQSNTTLGSGGGLFGASQSQPAPGGLFGQTQQNTGGFGSTLGGAALSQSQQQQQQMPNFQGSLSADPYGTDALFQGAGNNNGASSNIYPTLPFNVSASRTKKAPPLVPPFRPNPHNAAKITRLRGSTPAGGGFGRESTPGREGTPVTSLFGASSAAAARNGSPGVSLFRGLSDEQARRGDSLPPQAFTQRSSVKRLVLNEPSGGANTSLSRSLFGASAASRAMSRASSGTPGPARGDVSFGRSATAAADASAPAPRVAFSPALESSGVRKGLPKRTATADENTQTGGDNSFSTSLFNSGGRRLMEETPSRPIAGRSGNAPVSVVDQSLPSFTNTSTASAAAPEEEELPLGYFMAPTVAELDTWSPAELSAVSGFMVGRAGFGTIRFLEPVDLSTVDNLYDVAGGIVQIRSRECFVYPDASDCFDRETGDLLDGVKEDFDPETLKKAERGEGLNVPAIVTLEKCWPTDRATRQPIRDPENARLKQHIAKLKRQESTTFQDYEPKTGSWKFRVEHFSRYGLDDSEDEEDEAVAKAAQRPTAAAGKAAAAANTSAPPNRSLNDDANSAAAEDDEESEEDEMMSATPSVPDSPRRAGMQRGRSDTPLAAAASEHASESTPAPQPFAATLGLESRRVHVMQASFFGQGPSQAKVSSVDDSLQARKHARPSLPGASPQVAAAARSNFSQPVAATVEKRAAAAAAPAPLAGQARKFTRTELSKSVVAGAEHVVVDAGLALGRSFRVGWGPDGTIAHVGKLLGGLSGGTTAPSASSVQLEKLKFFKEPAEEVATADRLLQLQLAHSIIEVDNDDEELDDTMDEEQSRSMLCPVAYTEGSTRFSDFAASFDPNDRTHEASMWRLGVALFDEIDLRLPDDAPRELVQKVTVMRRKAALSAWLSHAVAGTVETESRGHAAANRDAALMFTYLSGHQLERACSAALAAGDVRLATLLAQAGSGDDEMRADIAEQLLQWRTEGTDAHMLRDHRRLYELLGGNVVFSEGTASSRSLRDPIDAVDDLSIAAGLDWKRALGLHLWYDTSDDSSLTKAVERYEGAVRGRGATAPPLPPYLESTHPGQARLKELARADKYDRDALFQMIKLHAHADYSLEAALNPRGFGAFAADYRLPWHVYMLLSRVLKARDFGDRADLGVEGGAEALQEEVEGNSATADSLTSSYAAQLELQGQWTWAAFVLLHLELESSREMAVRALIARHVLKLDSEPASQEFLIKTLRVPPQWLHEAKAHEAKARDDRFAEYTHLLDATLYIEAHDVAVRFLAPEAVIRGDLGLLLELFTPFMDAFPDGLDALPGWLTGGRAYVDYVACAEHLPWLIAHHDQGLSQQDQLKLERLAARVSELLELLPGLFPDLDTNLGQVVARADMLVELHNLARGLSVRNLAKDPALHWDASAPPEVEALVHVANDYCSLLV